MCGTTLLKELRSLRRKAGVPVIGRVHDLRHVAASLMLANGYPIATVASILGHRTAKTTLDVYAHAIPQHVISAPRNIADILPFAPPPQQQSERPAVRSAVPTILPPPSGTGNVLLANC